MLSLISLFSRTYMYYILYYGVRGVGSKLRLSTRDLRILVDAVRLAEEVKPSQDAKRRVFEEYGIIGTGLDRLLTAIFYDVMKKMGILDKIIERRVGVNPLVLDPWLRAGLRVALDLLVYHDLTNTTLKHLKWGVADYLSAKTHPFVGMYYWRLVDEWINNGVELKPRNKVEELEFKYLLPAWFINRMKELLGESEAIELFKSLNQPLPISIRVNTLKASVKEVLEELRREGVNAEVSSRVPVVIRFNGPYNFDKSRLFRTGRIVIQDEPAAYASIVLDPKPGMTVVDMCAAPGGKTSHIVELMKGEGLVYAFDVDPQRVKRMRELLRRTGTHRIVKIYVEDATKAPEILGEEIADRVLLDPPCSSTGTLPKNPELRWRLIEDKLRDIIDLQRRLLKAAVKLLKPGGRLLYTTCSLLFEENEGNVKWVLSQYPELRLVPVKGPYSEGFIPDTMRAWPHRHGVTGFFYALFEKKA